MDCKSDQPPKLINRTKPFVSQAFRRLIAPCLDMQAPRPVATSSKQSNKGVFGQPLTLMVGQGKHMFSQ